MKIQESAENYLEAILILNKRNGEVHAIDIAAELEFSKPSVSVAMKRLRENGYVEVNGMGHITLTDKGMEIAQRMYERHTFLSSWLASIGVDPVIAAEDACRMEHVISDETMVRLTGYLQKLLGHHSGCNQEFNSCSCQCQE